MNEREVLSVQQKRYDELSYVDPVAGDPAHTARLLVESLTLSRSVGGKAGKALKERDWGTAGNLLATKPRRSADEDNDLGVALANLALEEQGKAWDESIDAFKQSQEAAAKDGRGTANDLRRARARQNQRSVEQAKQFAEEA